jgi:hypothetical protein
MPIEFNDAANLQQAIRENYESSLAERKTRERLIEVYESKGEWWREDDEADRPLVNNFVQFVRGHVLSLAFGLPKWSVNARIAEAKGFDKRVQALLTRLMELLDFRNMMRAWALDTAFGRAIAKTIIGIAPKGINSVTAPRTYRVPPPYFIHDRTAQSIHESTFFADVYLVPLREAQNYPGYDAEQRAKISEWTETSERMIPNGTDERHFAQPMARLIDVYVPTQGAVYTWECRNDTFSEIRTQPPLARTRVPVNPYTIMQLTMVPDKPDDYALLETLLPLHLASNDMLKKALQQAKLSKRNPLYQLTAEQDMDTVLNAPDNEAAGVEDMKALGLYTLPGPDPSLVSMGSLLMNLFGQFGGNLEVALGQSAGADTARQTQALMGQLNALQSVARTEFEVFLADIGKKLATYAFYSQSLQLNMALQIPGLSYSVNFGWLPPHLMPRVGSISDYVFEITPFSTGFRQPQERIAQLEAASNAIMKWMQTAAMGAPVNLQAIMDDYAEAFDLVPNLRSWWSGEEVEPSPTEKAGQVYQSMAAAKGPSRREITYQGQGGGQGQMDFGQSQPGGVTSFAQ